MISESNKLPAPITLPLLLYIFSNSSTMVVQTRNEAISEDSSRQTMPTFKKPLKIPSPGPGKGSSASHNKGKTVYHKQ